MAEADPPAPQPGPPRDPANRVEPRLIADYAAWADQHKADAAAAKGRATAAERERDEAKAALTAAQAETAQKLAETQAKADERMIRTELRRAAKAAGLLDPRDLATLDVSKLKLTEDGDVEGLDAYLAALKAERGHLFGKPSTSNPGNPPPPPNPAGGKPARDMTADEWKAARAAMLAA